MRSTSAAAYRLLWYVPIVHTTADMGALAEALQKCKARKFGSHRVKTGAGFADRFWEETETAVHALTIPAGLRIYQDGLPVCGREKEIAADLARCGSRNHQLLLWLQERGAVLMGTESAELLVKEYELAQASLLQVAGKPRLVPPGRSLLEQRDRFIASRINQTLQPSETGVLFIGMLHSVQPYLDKDVRIIYPARNFRGG